MDQFEKDYDNFSTKIQGVIEKYLDRGIRCADFFTFRIRTAGQRASDTRMVPT